MQGKQTKKSIFIVSCFVSFLSLQSYSQTADSAAAVKKVDLPAIKISGYVDGYYAYYTDSVGAGNYQKFPAVSPRSNNFGLNAAIISAQYDGEKVRGIVTLHFGDIPRAVWAGTYNNVMEAHAGIRLTKKLWLDAGFFR